MNQVNLTNNITTIEQYKSESNFKTKKHEISFTNITRQDL